MYIHKRYPCTREMWYHDVYYVRLCRRVYYRYYPISHHTRWSGGQAAVCEQTDRKWLIIILFVVLYNIIILISIFFFLHELYYYIHIKTVVARACFAGFVFVSAAHYTQSIMKPSLAIVPYLPALLLVAAAAVVPVRAGQSVHDPIEYYVSIT